MRMNATGSLADQMATYADDLAITGVAMATLAAAYRMAGAPERATACDGAMLAIKALFIAAEWPKPTDLDQRWQPRSDDTFRSMLQRFSRPIARAVAVVGLLGGMSSDQQVRGTMLPAVKTIRQEMRAAGVWKE